MPWAGAIYLCKSQDNTHHQPTGTRTGVFPSEVILIILRQLRQLLKPLLMLRCQSPLLEGLDNVFEAVLLAEAEDTIV